MGKTAKAAREIHPLGGPVFESFLPENLIEHLIRIGVPVEFCRKTTTRKWARREADRLNRLITSNPTLRQRPNVQVSLPRGIPLQPDRLLFDEGRD